MNRVVLGMGLGVALAACQLCAQVPPDGSARLSRAMETHDRLEAAYRRGRAEGSLRALQAELASQMASDEATRRSAIFWVYDNTWRLSLEETEQLFEPYLASHSASDPDARVMREHFARRRLEEATAGERSQFYRRAVAEGQVDIGARSPFTATDALSCAAAEGLEEFRPVIERLAPELDRHEPQPGLRPSRVLLWRLDLTSGAADRSDGERLAIQRMGEIDPFRFLDLMEHDLAFRGVSEGVAVRACKPERPITERCIEVGRVYMRLEKALKALKAQGKSWEVGENDSSGTPTWFARFKASAQLGEVAIAMGDMPKPSTK